MNTAHDMQQLKERANWFFGLGFGLMLLGTLAVIFSFVSTMFSVVYLGILLTVLGLFEGIKSFKLKPLSSFLLHLILGILYVIGGIFIVMQPVLNAITLTLLLAIFFVVTGILKIIFALTKPAPHQGWLVFNGILTVLLGVLIWQQWPFSGLWVLGMFVGIDAIMTGWTWMMLSFALKRIK